jgi:hypothetical protein
MTSKAKFMSPRAQWYGVLAIGVLGTASAFAAPGKDHFPIAVSDLQAKQEARMQQIDTDGNGSIDMTEFENAKQPRHRGGRHGRGDMHGEGREGLREAVEAEMFGLLDSNGDGTLSRQEHAGATHEIRHLARKRAMFKHLDADQNGMLSAQELPELAARLAAADSDGDGKITKAEMRAYRKSHDHKRGADQGD